MGPDQIINTSVDFEAPVLQRMKKKIKITMYSITPCIALTI